MSWLRKPAAGDGPSTNGLPPGQAQVLWPALWEFLTATSWPPPDGGPRTVGTVLLFVETGRWKACLRDRECGQVAFVSAASAEGLLDALDAGLTNGSLDWRPDRPKGGKR